MLSKLSDALFDPAHSIVLVPLVWISAGLFVADKLDWYEPDYGRVVFIFIAGYLISIAIGLGIFGRR